MILVKLRAMNPALPVISVESLAIDTELCVEYVDLMLTFACWSRGIVVNLCATCVGKM